MHIGLRGRLIAVLAFVSALTLAVVAVGLLSPLDRRLRDNALENLSQAVTNERGLFTSLPAGAVKPGDRGLLRAARRLQRRSGADIALFSASGRQLVSTDPDPAARAVAAAIARRTSRLERAVTNAGQGTEAQVALPISIHERDATIVARKPIDDIQDTSRVVQRAFLAAAAAGLVGALLAGLLLARRMSSRIRRLRDTALRVAQVGPVAQLEPDRGHDEIGDLSRAFATMQERLREQEQARRAFVANASHELRTPLSSLRVMLDMLIEDLDAQPVAVDSARTQAANAERQADRLSQLAAELLDLSRIDAGVALRSEPVELDAVLHSVVAELDVRLAEQQRGVAIGPGDERQALGDPGSVAQIVRILIDNALRHTDHEVRARVEAGDGRVGISVADDGPGVAAADRERIFERFSRGADARDGGFGLGLAIARELAQRMDGDVVLEDSMRGARFVLWLPGATAG